MAITIGHSAYVAITNDDIGVKNEKKIFRDASASLVTNTLFVATLRYYQRFHKRNVDVLWHDKVFA